MRLRRAILPCVIAFALPGALAGCVLPPSSGQILYEQGRNVVRLEADDQGAFGSWQASNTHPVMLDPAQLSKVLHGIGIRSEAGFMATVLSLAVPAEPVFKEGDLAVLAPILAKGLFQATPSERVSFTFWTAQSARRTPPLSGSVSVRDPYLRFVLNDHPSIGWQDPEDPSSPKLFDLEFLREGFLLPGSEEERKGSYRSRPVIQIDYQRYLRYLEEQKGPTMRELSARDAAPSGSEALKELQREVKELTESNRELRAKLKEVTEGREEAREQSKNAIEELTKLRQELAGTKQLLADKILELNRLQNKLGGAGKGKK
jgi:hypothetical protein